VIVEVEIEIENENEVGFEDEIGIESARRPTAAG
jgi:hypothetical protein